MNAGVSVEDLEWLAGEYGGLLSSVHGDRCIGDGSEHCCNFDRRRADGIFAAISSLRGDFEDLERQFAVVVADRHRLRDEADDLAVRARVAEQALTAARTALNYISSPTMGLPSGADAAEFCMVGATEHAARYALNICIRQAREALSVAAGGASTTRETDE